jgi:hypothetical protein
MPPPLLWPVSRRVDCIDVSTKGWQTPCQGETGGTDWFRALKLIDIFTYFVSKGDYQGKRLYIKRQKIDGGVNFVTSTMTRML